MRLKTAVVATVCAAAEVAAHATTGNGATCSSLNGPFCTYFGFGTALAPLHAQQNLAAGEKELKALETDKSLKIENVMKEFEVQATTGGEDALAHDPLLEDEGIVLFEKMMGETLYTMLLGLDEDESSRATDSVVELLESLDGDALKGVFVIALDVLVAEATTTLYKKAPSATENVRVTAREFKAVKDYSTYVLKKLNKKQIESIQYKFDSRRFAMMQIAFQLLVIAGDASDRLLAIETTILVLQLAQEAAEAAKKLAENEDLRKAATAVV
uniref:Uncharacterized protein n=1 Tax=Peronospora matthiolae TaxID=2874970 RepID=A0AAV1UJY6_9STRA